MKFSALLWLVAFSLLACQQAPSNSKISETTAEPTDSGGSQDDPDLEAITGVIHGFYAWYDAFQKDETRNISYTSDKGKHLRLDLPKLEQYYTNLKASGFISQALIDRDKALMKKCETLWQTEAIDEVPSCLDADRFFCAQDWDMDFWTQAPVSVDGLGTDQVVATMSGMEGGPTEQKFDLKKENGKWLISRIYCDLGVE